MLVGLILILLLVFRPQGIFGNRRELVFDVR
jgi:ABC-type branched-subunit amino acid transport system permease subunit